MRASAEAAEEQLAEVQAQLAEAKAQLAAIQTQRASRKRRKQPTSPGPDWLLVEEVRGLLGLTVDELATRLGLKHSTVLGRADGTPLSSRVREKVGGVEGRAPGKNGRRRSRPGCREP